MYGWQLKDFTSNLRHHKGKSFVVATYRYSLVLLLAFHALKIATNPGSGAIIKDLCSRVLYDCDALGTALTRGPPPRHKGSKMWHALLLVVAPEVQQQHQRRAADPPAEAAGKAAALPRVAPLQPQPLRCNAISTAMSHLQRTQPRRHMSRLRRPQYGSEFVAARTAVDRVIELRHTLRYLGVPLATVGGSNASYMFGDNLSVVNSSVLPSGKLQKRAHILNYHRVREAQAAGIVRFVHIDGKENPADILTKPRSSRDWCRLMKPLIFWRHADLGSTVNVEGSDSRSPLPAPPVLASGAPKQSEKLHLHHVLGE